MAPGRRRGLRARAGPPHKKCENNPTSGVRVFGCSGPEPAFPEHPTTVSLFFNCIFILLVLTLLNWGLGQIRPRWALSRADLLVVYSMLAIGSCIAGHDMLQILVPMLCWPWRFANATNGWEGRWF